METSETEPTTYIAHVGTVGVLVINREPLKFCLETLGFEKRIDIPYGESERWVEVGPPSAATTIALVRPRAGDPGGIDTQMRFTTQDAEAALRAGGVDADAEVMRSPLPMPAFRYAGGNRLLIVERD